MSIIPSEYTSAGQPFYVLVICDDISDGGGEPIVWEHQFPAGVTLPAVMRQQARLAGRYGSSYIAECRIIPESKRDPVVPSPALLAPAGEGVAKPITREIGHGNLTAKP